MYSSDPADFNDLMSQAWNDYQDGDKAALDKILESLKPFCLRVCSKTCARFISEEDEEASIAMIAAVEALEKYDSAKGRFLNFLGQVIRNRIIDYKRKEKKQSIIPFSFLSKNGSSFAENIDDSFFEEIIDDLARKQEIERLKKLLMDFDIGFEELVQYSPRQPRSRENAKKIACLIAENQELSAYLMEKKMLPMKELEDKWKINRKIAERYRKYIITAALININDFPYLKSYVLPGQRGDENAF